LNLRAVQGDPELHAVWIASLFGWVFGSLLYIEFSWATGFLTPARDSLLIYLFFSAAFAALFKLCGAAIALAAWLLPGSGGARGKQAAVFFGLFAILWVHLSLLCIETQRPFAFDTSGLALLCVVLFLSLGVAWVAARSFRGPLVPAAGASALLAIVPLAILGVGATLSWSRSQPVPSGNLSDIQLRSVGSKVLMIGIDAGTWQIVDRLIAEGRLPHIAKLVSDGARGDLASIPSPLNPLANTSGRGMRTPVVWTTISTGKRPTEHGILDFVCTELPVLATPIPMRIPLLSRIGQWKTLVTVPRRPVNANAKRARDLWHILGALGRRVAVLGWVVTHPVSEVSGVMVSDLFKHKIEDRWYPPGLLPSEFSLVGVPDQRLSELWRFVGRERPSDGAAEMKALLDNPVFGDPLATFAERYVEDAFLLGLGAELYAREDFDFFAVYVDGTDVSGHFFWKYMEPEHFGNVDEREMGLFHGVIEEYYEYVDEGIGSILQHRANDTLVIVCSDHGMGPWTKESGPLGWLGSRTSYPFNSGNHRLEGIVLVNGPGVRRGFEFDGATVLDIAPTVLHYMGFPVGDDMPGRVLKEAFDEEWLGANSVARIDSYEGRVRGPRRGRAEVPAEIDEEIRDRLRKLGYID